VRELTCIVCPLGCRLRADEGADGSLSVSGNRCPRGTVYAEEEIRSPKRVVTATCLLLPAADGARRPARRVPVRGSAPCPKELVGDLLADIYALRVGVPVARGKTLIADWRGTGIDVVATRTIE